jgi:hypothetical protein
MPSYIEYDSDDVFERVIRGYDKNVEGIGVSRFDLGLVRSRRRREVVVLIQTSSLSTSQHMGDRKDARFTS